MKLKNIILEFDRNETLLKDVQDIILSVVKQEADKITFSGVKTQGISGTKNYVIEYMIADIPVTLTCYPLNNKIVIDFDTELTNLDSKQFNNNSSFQKRFSTFLNKIHSGNMKVPLPYRKYGKPYYESILIEQDIDSELDGVVDDLESRVKNAAQLVKTKQNEAVLTSALGLVVSGPFLIKMVGKVIGKAQKMISGSSNAGDAIQKFADKAHHSLEKPFKVLAKTFTKDPKKQSLFAEAMIAGIIAILLIDSGISFAKFASNSNIKSSLIYGLKSAIKSTELRGMIPELGAFVKDVLTKA